MQTTDDEVVSTGRLAERLVAARRNRFVGREAELALLRMALTQEPSPFVVLHLYGPGGVGKSALLRAYAQQATENGRSAITMDCRNLEPSPTGFMRALRQAMGLLAEDAYPRNLYAFPEIPATSVLLLDTYETVAGLDEWLRETFLPQLPEQALVIIAGRNAPAVAWTTDVEWAGLTRVLPIRNLRPEESQTLLTTRGIPATQHAKLLAVTHGHPLALCLIADAFAQDKAIDDLTLQKQPDIVRLLLERFVEGVPSARHRLALEVCVMVWATTEALLCEVMDREDAHDSFEWLRRLPFIEAGIDGLFPHDLAREVLDVDFRWRNYESHRLLYRKLIRYFYQRLNQAANLQQQRIWFDIFFLARANPYMAPYFDWKAIGSSYAEAATPEDLAAIVAMVQQHEGSGQAELVAYWFRRQPRAFRVYRNGDEVVGFMAHLAVAQATVEDIAIDPALTPALAVVAAQGPLHPGDEILYLRFWMGRDAHQGVSSAINLTAINASIDWTTHPKLGWNFISIHTPEYLEPHFTMIEIRRTPVADFVVDGHRYGVFSHDWRKEPASEWLGLKADRYGLNEAELRALSEVRQQSAQPVVLLSEPEFVDAARRAIREVTRPDQLLNNPLLRSRLVVEWMAEQEEADAVTALQAVLRHSAQNLKQNPKDEKLFRALWQTYFDPAATQEQAAEMLDLPFSTYRYHLTQALDRLVTWLWKLEVRDKP